MIPHNVVSLPYAERYPQRDEALLIRLVNDSIVQRLCIDRPRTDPYRTLRKLIGHVGDFLLERVCPTRPDLYAAIVMLPTGTAKVVAAGTNLNHYVDVNSVQALVEQAYGVRNKAEIHLVVTAADDDNDRWRAYPAPEKIYVFTRPTYRISLEAA